MQYSVTSSVRQVMGENEGAQTLLINNTSAYTLYLCKNHTDNPESDGSPLLSGAFLNILWSGSLYIGVNQSTTNGASVFFSITKSGTDKTSAASGAPRLPLGSHTMRGGL